MALTTSTAKITGTPGASGWVQIHEFVPSEEEIRELRGHLFLVIATSKFEEGVEGVIAGREIISKFQEEYYGDATLKPFDALKKSAEKIRSEFAESFGVIEISACALVNNVIYSAAGGGGQVAILRSGMLAAILETKGPEIISASGYPQEGDVLLLGTHDFFANISQRVIKEGLEGKSPEDAAETFTPLVHEKDDSGKIGAVIVEFKEERVETLAVSPVFVDTEAEAIPSTKISDIPGKLSGYLSKLGSFLPQKRIYIGEEVNEETSSRSKKLTLTVGIMLLAILAISIGFGIRQKNLKNLRSQYVEKLATANHNLDEADGLLGVDSGRARELFSQSDQIYKEISSLGSKDPKIDELGARLEKERGSVLGEFTASPELFLDLSLLSSGFNASDYSTSSDVIYILDKNNKKIVSVEIPGKKSKVVASQDNVGEAKNVASYEGRVFVLSADGVYEVESSRKKVIEGDWSGEAFVTAYTGNLYILDKTGNSIYRHSGTSDGFGTGSSWLAAGTKADFAEAKGFVIDGSVYVLFPNAKILKYSLGAPQNFSVKGEFPELTNIDAIYSNDETQYLYLLDKAGKRVVVTDKKGEYKAQYVGDEIGESTGLVVSEKEKKIILVIGDKLLSIEIKHL